MHRKKIVLGMDLKGNETPFPCSTYSQRKITAKPFPKQAERKSELLSLIHTDICGPIQVESRGKARYFLTFIDDYSRWCDVRFLRNKTEIF